MAAITITFSDDLLALILQAVPIANIADNAASAPLTQLWVSLHTASPGATGAQNTSEAAYTGYARVAINRTTSGWTISNENANPQAMITFPAATAGSETETYFGVGTAQTGVGLLMFFGVISPSIVVNNGVVPQLTVSTVISMS